MTDTGSSGGEGGGTPGDQAGTPGAGASPFGHGGPGGGGGSGSTDAPVGPEVPAGSAATPGPGSPIAPGGHGQPGGGHPAPGEHGQPGGPVPPEGYGLPGGYGPPAVYGPPPGYGPPAAYAYGYPVPANRGTNGFAIASLICAFACFPLGIVFGFVARSQIKQTGEGGEGLATAGIAVGFAFLALMVVYFIVVFAILGAALHVVNKIDFNQFNNNINNFSTPVPVPTP